ncbi:unnamed protein product [Coregonus sp. 'balchen']|nr:unnamed protein product [Coregonus sp. 'balchen']
MGLTLNEEKSHLSPSRKVIYLGMTIDSTPMRARLSQKKKSALFEVAEVVPVMTNNYEETILKGVQDSTYSLQSSIELLQKDVVQLHAPRYQSMRRAKFEFHHGDYEKQLMHAVGRRDKAGMVLNNPTQSVFLFMDRQHLQTPKTKATVFKLCSLCLYLPQDQLTCWGVGDIEDHLRPYMPD